MKGSVVSGLQKRACPHHATKTRRENTHKTDVSCVYCLFCLLHTMGAATRRTASWEYVAALVGGRAAAAFLFGWHIVFCVGRFAARKNTRSTFARAAAALLHLSTLRVFCFSLFLFFVLYVFLFLSFYLLCLFLCLVLFSYF